MVGIDPSLFYKGKEYPISVNGLSLGKVGFSGSSATGKVYNLKTLADFDGHYVGAGTGMTVAGGRSRVEMKNQNSVQVYLASASKGVDVSLRGDEPEELGFLIQARKGARRASSGAPISLMADLSSLVDEIQFAKAGRSTANCRRLGYAVRRIDTFFRILILLFALPIVAQARLFQRDIEFSNYDVPLYTQIVDRIKAKVSARLGQGTNTRDRYFIIPFAYQDRGNHPEFSHSFVSVIRVLADNKQPKLTPGLKLRKYRNREFEAFTISWLPHDFLSNPHLCVFDGAGSRIIPEKNNCPVSTGRNFTLAETIKLAVDAKNALAMWGPYEINKIGFDLGVRRKRLLDGGTISIAPMIVFIEKTKSLSVAFTPWPVWTSFSPTAGFSGRDLKCGVSMERPEY